ncbi:unnamed protein product [Amoebophrya sp. A25]|nr:unnamed protein product [Amoebophrya sp. A25]|eukprot:GSA25T00019731001.1
MLAFPDKWRALLAFTWLQLSDEIFVNRSNYRGPGVVVAKQAEQLQLSNEFDLSEEEAEPQFREDGVSFYSGRKVCFDRIDVRHQDCCNTAAYGEGGNPICWDNRYSFEACCWQSPGWEKEAKVNSCSGETASYCLHILRLTAAHNRMRFRGCIAEADRTHINGVNAGVPLASEWPLSTASHAQKSALWLLGRFLCHKVADYLSNAALFIARTAIGGPELLTEHAEEQQEGMQLEEVVRSSSKSKQGQKTWPHAVNFRNEVAVHYERVLQTLNAEDDSASNKKYDMVSDTNVVLLQHKDLEFLAEDLMLLPQPPGDTIPEEQLYLELFEVYAIEHRRTALALERVTREISSMTATSLEVEVGGDSSTSKSKEVENRIALRRQERDELLVSADVQLQQLQWFLKNAMDKVYAFMRRLAARFYHRLKPFLREGCEEDVCNDLKVDENARAIEQAGGGRLVSVRYEEEEAPSPQVTEQVNKHKTKRIRLPEPEVADLVLGAKKLVFPNCPLLSRSPGVRDFAPSLWPPPDFVPTLFRKDYLMVPGMGNSSSTTYYPSTSDTAVVVVAPPPRAVLHAPPVYFAQRSFTQGWAERHDWRWERAQIAKDINAVDVTQIYTSYGEHTLQEQFFKSNRDLVAGKNLLVLGSEIPWMETFLLRHGARTVTTVDYREPTVAEKHERLSFLHFTEVGKRFGYFEDHIAAGAENDDGQHLNETSGEDSISSQHTRTRLFDAAFTYSSLEHAGLGRYGDQLNPWADVQSASLVWCTLKPGGYFFTGPNTVDGNQWLTAGSLDRLYWNSGRDLARQGWARMMIAYEFDGNRSTRVSDRGYFAWRKPVEVVGG